MTKCTHACSLAVPALCRKFPGRVVTANDPSSTHDVQCYPGKIVRVRIIDSCPCIQVTECACLAQCAGLRPRRQAWQLHCFSGLLPPGLPAAVQVLPDGAPGVKPGGETRRQEW